MMNKKPWIIAAAAAVLVGGLWFWKTHTAAPVIHGGIYTLESAGSVRVNRDDREAVWWCGNGRPGIVWVDEGGVVRYDAGTGN